MTFEIGGTEIKSGLAISIGAIGAVCILVGSGFHYVANHDINEEAVRSDPDIAGLLGKEDVPSRVLTPEGRKRRMIGWWIIGIGVALFVLALKVEKEMR
jgi:hypothetical protein